MKQKMMLYVTHYQLKELYKKELPELIKISKNCETPLEFKKGVTDLLNNYPNLNGNIKKQIETLINYDQKEVFELSTEKTISINTISLLFNFLKFDCTTQQDTSIDLLLELFYVFFDCLHERKDLNPSYEQVNQAMDKWKSGLDKEIIKVRNENKERLIHLLIEKIENRKSKSSRFIFNNDSSYDEKYKQVQHWWNDYRFHLSMAIKDPSELNHFLQYSLSTETMHLLEEAYDKGMPFFCTPYYLSLLSANNEFNDEAIRSYILYSPELVETFGDIHAWEKEDVVKPGEPNAAGWLLPEGHNIHRRYPEVAILIPDTMGRACGGLCASCQRMYDFQSKHLNFEFETLRPQETWNEKLTRLMNYFEEDSQIRDILITGGDALMSQNKTLKHILNAVLEMSIRKQEANKQRGEGEKYAQLQRVRLGSRLLAYLPMRINEELLNILKEFKEKASKYGIKQFVIQTHFQSPLELTPEAADGIKRILSTGWTITNQLVYNVAASRRGHTAQLRKLMNEQGVLPYYTFSVKGFKENRAVFAPISRSMQEQKEEKVFGKLSDIQKEELTELMHTDLPKAEAIGEFMQKNELPFLSTDRSVLNLPGIGKSMTFKVIGLTPQGKRVLLFDHDHTRKHSPIIDKLGKIVIVENKSIAEYLRQLNRLNENIEDYSSIWYYREGDTEPAFNLYKYPHADFVPTDKVNHLGVE